MDLDNFFDKVNHEKLMEILETEFKTDGFEEKLICKYLQSGLIININDVIHVVEERTPTRRPT